MLLCFAPLTPVESYPRPLEPAANAVFLCQRITLSTGAAESNGIETTNGLRIDCIFKWRECTSLPRR